MKNRIRELRKELGLNQTDFGERIGIKQTTVAGYENGIRQPMDAVISSICKEFNVNENWLRTGEGEMFKPRKPEDEVGYYVEELLEGDDNPFYGMIIDMMKTYQGLDDKSKEVVRNYFHAVRESIKKED